MGSTDSGFKKGLKGALVVVVGIASPQMCDLIFGVNYQIKFIVRPSLWTHSPTPPDDVKPPESA